VATLSQLIGGAIVLGVWSIALFFFRFWKKTRDRLFIYFALAFVLLGLERIVLAAMSPESELKPYVYLIRLAAFLLIIIAIIDKNRVKKV